MKKSFRNLIIFAAGLLFLGQGCIQVRTGPRADDGGVFKSVNKGADWAQKVLIPTVTPQKRTIATANIVTIVADPSDNRALYAGTAENGMLFTYDGGESWFPVGVISYGRVPSVAVDPKDKCVIYAAFENKVLKTYDCSRTFETVYFESRVDKQITGIAIDSFNTAIIYAGTSSGDLIKSTDSGKSWAPIHRFENLIRKILIAPYDTRIVYVATAEKGIFKTTDAGGNWADVNKGLEQFSGAQQFRDLVFDLSSKETLILASQYGLTRTNDGGTTWQKIDLLTPPGSATIYSLAVSPKSGNEIYYATGTTFYKTENGGFRWTTRKLPTSRAATALLIDPGNPSVLYMGVTKLTR